MGKSGRQRGLAVHRDGVARLRQGRRRNGKQGGGAEHKATDNARAALRARAVTCGGDAGQPGSDSHFRDES